jgi:hypothetical protein
MTVCFFHVEYSYCSFKSSGFIHQMQWHKPMEVEIGRIAVQGQLRQKVQETPSQSFAGCNGSCLSSQLGRKAQIGERGAGREREIWF